MGDYLKMGQIINTHGHKGDLKIYPLTDDLERFLGLSQVYVRIEGNYRKYRISRARVQQNLVILTLAEVADMNEAEKLKGLYLEIPINEAPPLPPGHYYEFQIIGLEVYEESVLLGKVTAILRTGSNDVYEVTAEGGKKLYLPALKAVVRQIDLESGKMMVVIPPGLLD